MTLAIRSLGDKGLELTIDGKLDEDDYRRFVPMAEQRIRERGELNLVLHVEDFRGWSPAALWEDLKFDVKHYNDVSRLAVVSDDESSAKWMARLSRPFTGAEVEHFPASEIERAREWIRQSAATGAVPR